MALSTTTFPVKNTFVPITIVQRSPLSLASIARFGFEGGKSNGGILYANNVLGLKDAVTSFKLTKLNKVVIPNDAQLVLLSKRSYAVTGTNVVDVATGIPLLAFNYTNLPVSVATVRNQQYLFIPNIGLYEYNEIDNTLVLAPVDALELKAIKGIISGGNRLLIYTDSAIHYGQIIDTTNFTPSPLDGAGVASITSLLGSIISCLPIANGFIVYTTQNAIMARDSGNVTAPYKYDALTLSGVADTKHVTDSGRGYHAVFTGDGFYAVTATGNVEQILDEVLPKLYDRVLTILKGGSSTETANANNQSAIRERDGKRIKSEVYNTAMIHKQVELMVVNRHIVLLVRTDVGNLAVMYLYNTDTRKAGISHGDYRSLVNLGLSASTDVDLLDSANELYSAIGCLDGEGCVRYLDIHNKKTHKAEIVIGGFEHSRDAFMYVDSVYLTDVEDNATVSIATSEIPHEQNEAQEATPLYKIENTAGAYDCNVSCKSFSVRVEGGMHLVDLRVRAEADGTEY